MKHTHTVKCTRSGFTLIEVAVVAVIVAILATALLSRALFYQEQAEKVAVEQMLGTLRSALHLQIADKMAKGNAGDVAQLLDQNPMSWLGEKPANYVGEYYAPRTDTVEQGNWYFDPSNKNLVYLVINSGHLHTAAGESNRLRFQLKLVKSAKSDPVASPNDANLRSNMIVGVILEPVVAYKWF